MNQTTYEAGAVVGTTGYISPEQLRGFPADHRSDIFALGCVLYEVLSGKAPFPICWSSDGKALFVVERGDPARIVRVDVATGKLVLIKELVPADFLAKAYPFVAVTPDGSTYAYAYLRQLSELYLVEGLR